MRISNTKIGDETKLFLVSLSFQAIAILLSIIRDTGWSFAMKKTTNALLMLVVFLTYPAIYMAPVLNPGTRSRIGSGRSDMNGAIILAQQLKNMRFPWSRSDWLGFPDESSFWIFTRFSQTIHWIIFYVLTRFFSAFEAVNLSILLGWSLTGLLAYLVAKEIGVSKLISIGVGLATQLLPWIREKIEEHLSYVYICVPLLVILCLLKFAKASSLKNSLILIVGVAFSFIFDLYWFYFVFYLIIFMLLVLYAKKIALLKTSLRIIILAAGLITALLVYQIMSQLLTLANGQNSIVSSRTLGVPDWQFVHRYSGSPADYINRDPLNPLFPTLFDPAFGSDNIFYVGVSIVVLALIGIVCLIRNTRKDSNKIVLVALLFTFLLSLRKVDFGIFSVPAINQYLKYVMPGARVFLRSGLIAQALLVVTAGVGLQYLSSKVRTSGLKVVLVTIVALVVMVDLQPFKGRAVYRDGEDFRILAGVLSDSEDPAFLNTNPELFRTPEFLNQPTLNTFSNWWKVRLYPHAAKGSTAMADYLNSIGVGFVVAPVNQAGVAQISGWVQDSTFFTTVLDENEFVPIGDEFTTSDSGDIVFRLLKVQSASPDSSYPCVDCILAIGDISPQLLVDGTDFGFQQQITLWANEPVLSIRPREIDSITAEKFRIRITFISAGGSAATPQIVRFRVGGKNGEFDLSLDSAVTKDFWIPKGETLLLEAKVPCFVPSEQINTDNRQFCWGISSLIIESVR
jgi:hypothetical protein